MPCLIDAFMLTDAAEKNVNGPFATPFFQDSPP